VGVLDKSVALVRALADGPLALAELVDATGISRPTTHRLASALVEHGLVRRADDGRFALGADLVGLGHAAAASWPWGEAAGPALVALVEATGESAQLYVREGDVRRCLLARESTHELRTIVPEGARLALGVGSAGRVLLAADRAEVDVDGDHPGWVESVEERAPGVASVSAPVRDRSGRIVAAVGVSGPVERTSAHPGARYGDAVLAAARRIEAALPR
jgi:DNA-binding IclR family transcriptional regulator